MNKNNVEFAIRFFVRNDKDLDLRPLYNAINNQWVNAYEARYGGHQEDNFNVQAAKILEMIFDSHCFSSNIEDIIYNAEKQAMLYLLRKMKIGLRDWDDKKMYAYAMQSCHYFNKDEILAHLAEDAAALEGADLAHNVEYQAAYKKWNDPNNEDETDRIVDKGYGRKDLMEARDVMNHFEQKAKDLEPQYAKHKYNISALNEMKEFSPKRFTVLAGYLIPPSIYDEADKSCGNAEHVGLSLSKLQFSGEFIEFLQANDLLQNDKKLSKIIKEIMGQEEFDMHFPQNSLTATEQRKARLQKKQASILKGGQESIFTSDDCQQF